MAQRRCLDSTLRGAFTYATFAGSKPAARLLTNGQETAMTFHVIETIGHWGDGPARVGTGVAMAVVYAVAYLLVLGLLAAILF